MKQFFTFLLSIFFAATTFAQVQDDFSDGNFSTNPAWTGDDAKFEVNVAQQLHLNAPAVADTANLSTPNIIIDNLEWVFYFKMDFSPSNSNYLKAYLVADQSNLKLPQNGYFLKMGEDGSNDAIDLYLQQGTTETLILSGIDGHVAATVNSIGIKVTRDNAGNWQVYSDISGGTNYSLEGTVTDNTITTTGYFGFFCKYTSTRSDAFYFDNIHVGEPVVDIDPPQIVAATAISPNQLDLLFNEPVEQLSAEEEFNYSVNNSVGNPSIVQRDITNPQLVHLTFTNSFPNGITSTVTVNNIKDLLGNMLVTATADFAFYTAQANDVVINEIMSDPDPAVGLPAAEFTELFNQSAVPIDLTGWTFSDATSTQTLSAFILQPDSFVILCDDGNASLFTSFGNVIGLPSFPSLNNDGDELTIKNSFGSVINTVAYSSSWYGDVIKAEGGWSLELIDPNSPCQGTNNWIASNNASGGTPGKKNSVFGSNPDIEAPHLISAALIDASGVQLIFNESLDSAVAAQLSNYQIDPSRQVLAVTVVPPDFTTVALLLNPAIDSNVVYTVTVNSLSDCSGNVIDTNNTAQFAIPGEIAAGEILINELLFNPMSGGYDYLEIYNNAEKIIDLKDLSVATTDNNDSLISIKNIVTESALLFPGQYMVLTENPVSIKQSYLAENPDWFIDMDLPTFNDDEGVVVLVNQSGSRIDQFHYYASWQFALIDDVEGVALERIYFNSPTQDSLNWHSAASTIGFGTPSYKNSQYIQPGTSDEITISPEAFSPDQDGFNDVLSISYQFDQSGYTANIRIFDEKGRLVTDLVHNALLSQSGLFTWDGITDKNEKAAIGIYMVYVELFNLDGTVKKYKKACVVAAKKS
ncbi:MAG: lamin tail domain-containing protein [Chitinophagaceae bacterium]|nr:lamin tail domain-containing protein [Chitinophagaceae bacterium]